MPDAPHHPRHSAAVRSGIPAVDRYLDEGFAGVVGMSSRFAAAICGGLMRIQRDLGVTGPVAEIGPFEGRFFIALAHALGAERGGARHRPLRLAQPGGDRPLRGQLRQARRAARAAHHLEGRQPHDAPRRAAGEARRQRARFFHIDGEHSRAALTKDLELATAVLAPGGVIVLDDMLHPGYPTLMVAVHEYLQRHPEMCVLCIIDRETIVAATKFVLCRTEWFKRYEERLLEAYKDNVWPLGADFEPHWCLVLSLDTRLAAIV